MLTVILWILAFVLITAGFVGLIAPALPGPPLVYLGIVCIAWAHDFERIGPASLVIFGVATLGIVIVDLAASAVGAKRFGATRWGVAGAVVGFAVGVFFGPLGLVLGPLVGAVGAEMIAGRTTSEAARAGWGATLGLIAGTVAKVALCLAMLVAALLDLFL